MKKGCILLVIFLATWINIWSQELNCSVKINSDQIEGTNKQVFTALENALSELINTRKWTETQFSPIEKIDCTMLFTITNVPNQNRYAADLIVQARRPVYNAAYTTSLFNFKDTEIEFSYIENEPLEFNEYSVDNNLVAIVAFYVYMILAADFDSFSLEGGTPFLRLAENIVTLSQANNERGWKAFDSRRNRHALVTAIQQESAFGFRNFWYDYHRRGLDDMVQNVEKGRNRISADLTTFSKIHQIDPQNVLLSFFIDAKLDELINIYSKASQTEKESVYKLLLNIYPAYSSRLAEIRKENK